MTPGIWTPEDAAYHAKLVPQPHWFGGTGATRLTHDPRDWQTRDDPVIAAMIPAAPASYSLLQYVTGPAYDQDGTGACVAASTCGVCSTDTQQFKDAWHVFHWLQLYHEAGGTGQNGVDSRLVLKICTDQGTPLATGGREFVIATYDFVTQRPGAFREEVKACIASGFPVTVALLLPSDFGWQSGQPSAGVTTGYHQVEGIGYDADYLIIFNSWGQGWTGNAAAPRPGVGSIRWDYLEADGMQHNYCYAYRTTAKTNGQPIPTPPPVAVTAYHPNPVASAGQFSIQGAAFDQGQLTVTWQGITLPILGKNPDVIATQAPAVTSTQSGPVHVQVGSGGADGPPLTVQADVTPIPPPVKTKAAITGGVTGADVSSLAPGQTYPLGSGMTLQLKTVTFDDNIPVPPGQISVTGYNPPQVTAGGSFQILGSGFGAGGNLIVTWGDQQLSASRANDTVIQATAPTATSGTNPVTVRIEALTATGPPLTVIQGDPQPGGIKVLLTTKPSQLRNTVSIIAYTADANGGSLPASVNGTVVGSQGTIQLGGQTTHGTQGPATWTVKRPAPWGEACQCTVNAFTSGMTGTATKPG